MVDGIDYKIKPSCQKGSSSSGDSGSKEASDQAYEILFEEARSERSLNLTDTSMRRESFLDDSAALKSKTEKANALRAKHLDEIRTKAHTILRKAQQVAPERRATQNAIFKSKTADKLGSKHETYEKNRSQVLSEITNRAKRLGTKKAEHNSSDIDVDCLNRSVEKIERADQNRAKFIEAKKERLSKHHSKVKKMAEGKQRAVN